MRGGEGGERNREFINSSLDSLSISLIEEASESILAQKVAEKIVSEVGQLANWIIARVHFIWFLSSYCVHKNDTDGQRKQNIALVNGRPLIPLPDWESSKQEVHKSTLSQWWRARPGSLMYQSQYSAHYSLPTTLLSAFALSSAMRRKERERKRMKVRRKDARIHVIVVNKWTLCPFRPLPNGLLIWQQW